MDAKILIITLAFAFIQANIIMYLSIKERLRKAAIIRELARLEKECSVLMHEQRDLSESYQLYGDLSDTDQQTKIGKEISRVYTEIENLRGRYSNKRGLLI